MNEYSYDEVPDNDYWTGYPSLRRRVLDRLVGKKVVRLTRHMYVPIEEMLGDERLRPQQLFSRGCGSVEVEVEDGTAVEFCNQESWVSLTVWLNRDGASLDESVPIPNPEDVPIEATDPTHSERRHAAVIGKRIHSYTILKYAPADPALEHYPNELAVVLRAEDGSELILGYKITRRYEDCYAITRDEIDPAIAPHLHPLP